jgi:TetR/AcrR family transcriptional regulator, transcriptional repressor for nem operon
VSEAPTFRTFDTDALADHLFVTFQGTFILSRSMNNPRHMRAQLAVLR